MSLTMKFYNLKTLIMYACAERHAPNRASRLPNAQTFWGRSRRKALLLVSSNGRSEYGLIAGDTIFHFCFVLLVFEDPEKGL